MRTGLDWATKPSHRSVACTLGRISERPLKADEKERAWEGHLSELMEVGLPGTRSAKPRDERGRGCGPRPAGLLVHLVRGLPDASPVFSALNILVKRGLSQHPGCCRAGEWSGCGKRDSSSVMEKELRTRKSPLIRKEVKGPDPGISQRGQGRKGKDGGDGQRAVSERVAAEGEQAEGSSRWTPKSPERWQGRGQRGRPSQASVVAHMRPTGPADACSEAPRRWAQGREAARVTSEHGPP